MAQPLLPAPGHPWAAQPPSRDGADRRVVAEKTGAWARGRCDRGWAEGEAGAI